MISQMHGSRALVPYSKPLTCRIGLHRPEARELWNNGYYFTRCARCACDMIRKPSGSWKPVPRGFKVVWKQRTAFDIDWMAWTREQKASEYRAQAEAYTEAVPRIWPRPSRNAAEPASSGVRPWVAAKGDAGIAARRHG